jgi:hypothetical protein
MCGRCRELVPDKGGHLSDKGAGGITSWSSVKVASLNASCPPIVLSFFIFDQLAYLFAVAELSIG